MTARGGLIRAVSAAPMPKFQIRTTHRRAAQSDATGLSHRLINRWEQVMLGSDGGISARGCSLQIGAQGRHLALSLKPRHGPGIVRLPSGQPRVQAALALGDDLGQA